MKFRITAAILFFCHFAHSGGGERVTKTINLLNDPAFSDFTWHLNDKRSSVDTREEAWNLKEGVVHVSGKGWGYLRTNKEYKDYHLVLEYQWAERTYGGRADKARDGGVMVHGYGPDGAFGDMFLSSFQAQLLDGGSGDLIALASRDKSGKPAPTSMKAKVRKDRDGEAVWDPAGTLQSFPAENQIAGKVNWKDKDPNWKDVKGYRGKNDIENPAGEWNRLEVICRGDTIQLKLNGELVNEASEVSPASGYVCLQSEASEMHIRRWELWPLDQFAEEWKEELRSTNTGYRTDGESILPRRFALSPEESAAAWKVYPGYELQLVAAEPLTCDPVDVVWDEKGQMFVAEMGDYPLPAGEGEYLSRIRQLFDDDGDGVMDRATTWAGNLDHVQGLLPINGGLIATTRTAILFLKDSDNDGKADVRMKLFEQNEPRHNQLQVSSPRWGLDNAIYFNNGLDLKEIYPVDSPDDKLDAKSRNLRYDPYLPRLTAIGGRGQFGATIDNWNRRFFSTNRNPVIFAAMPMDAAARNPFAAITQVQEDIDEPGAKLRPVRLSHTTSVAHAGTYTAACGIGIYRGDLMPDLAGNVFVCDPTAQVVTCSKLITDGASFSVERVADRHEFLASEDEWARPVNIRNGPDGALYICDMYRRFIDHARFFPEEFSKSNYMRAGFDHGRIWRLVAKGTKAPKVEALPEDPSKLLPLLESENGWQRTHAQRVLMEKGYSKGAAELLKSANTHSAQAAAHVMWLLQGQGDLTDQQIREGLRSGLNGGYLENVISLADPVKFTKELIAIAKSQSAPRASFLAIVKLGELDGENITKTFAEVLKDPAKRSDPWIRKAILSGSRNRTGEILTQLLASGRKGELKDQSGYVDTVREFATVVGAHGEVAELARVLQELKQHGSEKRDAVTTQVRFAFAEGLSGGLRRSQLKQKTLAAVISSPPEELKAYTEMLDSIVSESSSIVLDRTKDTKVRLAALPLAAQQGQEATFGIVEKLIEQSEPVEIQRAACDAMKRFKREEVAQFFFDRWDDLAPTPRREALDLIATHSRSAILLMKKMKAGEISAAIMPPMQRWSFGRSSNEEIKQLATELFGKTNSDRSKVVADYLAAVKTLKGDPEAGKQVFQKGACFTCHNKGGIGVDVGPPLADVKIKPDGALLTDILDPNRAVEERWAAYQIDTKSGQSYAGLVAAETANTVEIKVPGGHSESIPRDQIEKTTSTGLSLMPVGLEAAITKQEMADLLAFLRQ